MNSHDKRNWSEYNKSLINRGSLNIWIERLPQEEWVKKQKKRGRPAFSKFVIELGWVLKIVYRLSLRALQGFLKSILQILKLELTTLNYTLFSKRAHELSNIPKKLSSRQPTDLVIDASGVKIYGEGEWKVKIHGASNHRKWLKLHIAMDPVSQEVVAVEVTESNVADSTMLKPLIEKAPRSIRKVVADGAYDRTQCRNYLRDKSIKAHIPPAINARPQPETKERNADIEIIEGLGGGKEGKRLWKKLTGYHVRSLVETVFSRLKRLFGDRLKCKKRENQKVEANLSFFVLNRMTQLSNVN